MNFELFVRLAFFLMIILMASLFSFSHIVEGFALSAFILL